jgi:hypothetical protein
MKLVALEKSALSVSDIAMMAKNGPVILTRKGKPLAAVKDLSGKDWESVSLANNPRFRAIIEEARRSYRQHGGIGIDEVRKELGLAPAKKGRKNSRKRKKKR